MPSDEVSFAAKTVSRCTCSMLYDSWHLKLYEVNCYCLIKALLLYLAVTDTQQPSVRITLLLCCSWLTCSNRATLPIIINFEWSRQSLWKIMISWIYSYETDHLLGNVFGHFPSGITLEGGGREREIMCCILLSYNQISLICKCNN